MSARVPRGIFTCPSRENLITVETLHKEYPAGFASFSGDKFVLHAGGCCFRIGFSGSPGLHLHPQIERMLHHTVSIFVLDTNFILWAPALKLGVEIPFEYGVPMFDGTDGLVLQLRGSSLMNSSDGTPVALLIRPARDAEVSAEDIEPDLRAMIPHDSSLRLIHAMYTRWLHFYESTDVEDLPTGEAGSRTVRENFRLGHGGDADDLDNYEQLSEGDAGMNIALEFQPVGAVRRQRAHEGTTDIKSRRIG